MNSKDDGRNKTIRLSDVRCFCEIAIACEKAYYNAARDQSDKDKFFGAISGIEIVLNYIKAKEENSSELSTKKKQNKNVGN